jgi:hypothetical protein
MKSFKTYSLLLLTVAAMAPGAIAAEKPAAHSAAKNSTFDKFKDLAGEWEVAQTSSDHGMPGGSISYKVTAGGAAVVETTFQGTPHEMLTMYYIDTDGGLCLTHYCVLGNRPHMRVLPQTSAETVVFKCDHKDNAAIENEDHMHQATFTFLDRDHVKTEWVLYKDGKADSAHGFTLVRKKK